MAANLERRRYLCRRADLIKIKISGRVIARDASVLKAKPIGFSWPMKNQAGLIASPMVSQYAKESLVKRPSEILKFPAKARRNM